MLDAYLRPIINKPLQCMGKILYAKGIKANHLTIISFVWGLFSMGLIYKQQYIWAVATIMANRLCDGLDGAVAHFDGRTNFGGFLDIVCDFIIYAGIVFAFGMQTAAYKNASLFLLFSFVGPMVSFLAYAIIAEKKGVQTSVRGKKSFYYLGGLCEGTETACLLILICLFPYTFGTMCWFTTIGRIYATYCLEDRA